MKKRKFLAVLLVLAMTLSLLPTAALAAALPSESGAVASVADQDGNVYYYFDNLAEAFENAKTGDTVKLLTDYEDPGAAGAGIVYHMDGMIFDLNSHSYTSANFAHIFRGDNAAIKNGKMICSGGGSYALFIGDVPSTANFVVENVQCTGGINVYNAKDVVIKGDTTSVVGTKYYAIWCDEASDVTVEGGTYTAGSKAPIGMATLVAAEEDAASLTINGGHFIDNGKGLVLNDGVGTYKPVIKGGTFSVDPSSFVTAPYAVTGAGPFTVACAHTGTLGAHAAVPADCTNDGTKAYWECTNCGKLFSDALATTEIAAPETDPATGHTAVTDDAIPATCTTTGLTEGSHCSVCGTVLVAQTTVPATGHTFGDWTVTKEPTTTETGSKTRECSVCHTKETADIPVLGTYAITVNVTNGTVITNPEPDNGTGVVIGPKPGPNPAKAGETVTLVLAPNQGYHDADIHLYYSYDNIVNTEIHYVTITVLDVEAISFSMPDADVTVTGTFNPIAYQITYNLDGGTNSASNPSTYTVEKGFSLTAPTKSGYTFLGWSFNNNTDIIKEVTVKDGSTGDITFTAHWKYNSSTGGSTGGGGGSGSSASSEVTTNPDGSTTTTTTDKTTGTITEVTKETDGSTTTVETKKDGTVTETVETANGTTGTVVTDKNGEVTEVSASVSAAAADDAAKTGAAVTLPVEVPVTKTTDSAPAVEVSVPKSSGSVKVEIPVENVTAGTVAVIVHADGTEEIVKTSVTTENGVALTLDGSATVKIIDNSKEFNDVQPVNHWAQDSIDFVTSRELFNGTSTTTFSPNEPTTRAQLMTVLARLDGADTTGAALEKGMSWAVEKGVSDGSNPNGTISRQQLAVMLYRYAGSPATQQVLDYPDADKVDGYAEDAMKWAVENGIVGGMDDGTLNPQGPATRAQVAAMMARFCTKMA